MFAKFQETKDSPVIDIYMMGLESEVPLCFYDMRGNQLDIDGCQERFDKGDFHQLQIINNNQYITGDPLPHSMYIGRRRARLAINGRDFIIGKADYAVREHGAHKTYPIDINLDFFNNRNVFTLVRMVSTLVPIMAVGSEPINGIVRYTGAGEAILSHLRTSSEEMQDLYVYTLATVAIQYGFELLSFIPKDKVVFLHDPYIGKDYAVRSRVIIDKAAIVVPFDNTTPAHYKELVEDHNPLNLAIADVLCRKVPTASTRQKYKQHFELLDDLLKQITEIVNEK